MQLKQAAFRVSNFTVENSPTFQPGNLAINSNYLVYMLINDATLIVVYNLKDILQGSASHPIPIQLPTQAHPTSIKYLTFYGRQLLVITTMQGFLIYNENATELLHQHTQALGIEVVEEQQCFYQDSCVAQLTNGQQFVVVGSTHNELYYAKLNSNENGFVVTKGNQFKSKVKQITCMDSLPQKSQLMICDQEGTAHMFITHDMEGINLIKSVTVNSNKMPIICCGVLQQPNLNLLCCGDAVGKLTLIELNEFQIYATINAHARLITDLTCFDNMSQVVTVSEDTYLNIWNVRANQVDLENSIRISDSLIYAVGAQDRSLVALVYDANVMTLIKF